MFDLKAHLKSLVECHAPSGHEAAARAIVRDAWKDLVDEMEQDGLGSLIGIKRATEPVAQRRRVMIAAHMDEIALLVKGIEDGFITVHRISGVDNRLMLAQQVMVHGKRMLPGVVATVPPHLLTQDQRGKYPAWDELVVDVGLPDDEVRQLVRPGDLITHDSPMLELQNGRVAGKAMDDRACVAAVTACLHHLQGIRHRWDVYAVATVQEETGLLGAKTAAYQIGPDVGIALDVTFASQPGVDSDVSSELGGGPSIGIGPNFHPKLVEQIKATAKRNDIKLQEDVLPGASGTDAWAIQVSRQGVPTVLLQVPLRSMHSTVETVEMRDVERLGRLLALVVSDLDADFLTTIQWDEKARTED